MVAYNKKGGIGIVEFNDAGSRVNLLSGKNLERLRRIIEHVAKRDRGLEALVFVSGKKDIFIAGADINELAAIRTKKEILCLCKRGQDVFNRIESLPMPSFAIVGGACVGGGLEMALSCDYILVARSRKVKLGLPETRLGISPGFGGSHRLAERTGSKKAKQLIDTGDLIGSREAVRLNIADGFIPESIKIDYKALINIHKGSCGKTSRRALKRSRQTSSPEKKERELVARKIFQEPARNSLSLYPLISRYKQHAWIRPRPKRSIRVKRCAVIGSGTMGKGIAYLINSETGRPTGVTELKRTALRKAKTDIKGLYDDAVERGFMDRGEYVSRFKNMTFGEALLADPDIVLESVTEELSVKQNLFTGLEQKLNDNCIVATNTSCLSVERLADSFSRPGRFLGMHFFNPAYKMKLVEVVPTRFTSKVVLASAIDFLRSLRRIAIVVKDSPGFFVNRVLLPYLNEAILMSEQGFLPNNIERAMLDFGMPMGPFRLLEEIGPDVAYKASKALECGSEGRLKVARGLGDRKQMERLFQKAKVFKRPRSGRASRVIVEGLLQPMRRESELCLKEGVVADREIIDAALFLGAGFPASKRIWKKQ